MYIRSFDSGNFDKLLLIHRIFIHALIPIEKH